LSQLATGHSDAAALVNLARGRLRAKLPALRQALTGRFSEHHAFLLSHLLADLDYLEESMSTLAERIEQKLAPFAQELERLSTIPGVKRINAAVFIAEMGIDMNRFPTDAHLASWGGMAPGNNESAGKRRRAKARRGNRWLPTALVESGHAAGRTRDTALAAIYRRMVVQKGRKHAAFVVSRHILTIAYHLLAQHSSYREAGAAYLQQRHAQRAKRRCLANSAHSVSRSPSPHSRRRHEAPFSA
jgi:transposase